MSRIAAQIAASRAAADAVIDAYLAQPAPDRAALEAMLRRYIPLKLQLTPDDASADNITILVRRSVSKASGIPIEQLQALDRPGACGSAPTVLAKRVLLFVDIQKKLGVTLPPLQVADIQTISDLASMLIQAGA